MGRASFINGIIFLAIAIICSIQLSKLVQLHLTGDETNYSVFESSSSQQQQKDGRRRPLFILHVGPPKTATTALQIALTKYRLLLLQNDYVYLGKYEFGNGTRTTVETAYSTILKAIMKECEQNIIKDNDEGKKKKTSKGSKIRVKKNCWKKLMLDPLEYYYNNSQNLIVSEEVLSMAYRKNPYKLQLLKDALTKLQWDVRIVISYRRYYEWLPSLKDQKERFTPAQPKRGEWFSNGGMPSRDQWRTLKGMLYRNNIVTPNATRIIKNFKPYFDHIVIANNHNGYDVVQNFFCNILPSAREACRHSQEEEARSKSSSSKRKMKKANKSTNNYNYDILALIAETKGLINTTKYRRRAVGRLIQQYQENVLKLSPYDFAPYLTCPSKEELDLFLSMSLKHEQIVLPAFYNSPLGKDKHIQDFWTYANQNKYCTIDGGALLENNSTWIQFFQKFK